MVSRAARGTFGTSLWSTDRLVTAFAAAASVLGTGETVCEGSFVSAIGSGTSAGFGAASGANATGCAGGVAGAAAGAGATAAGTGATAAGESGPEPPSTRIAAQQISRITTDPAIRKASDRRPGRDCFGAPLPGNPCIPGGTGASPTADLRVVATSAAGGIDSTGGCAPTLIQSLRSAAEGRSVGS